MSKTVRDIKAKIILLPPEQGGRTIAAKNGYRPQFFYDQEHWDAAIELIDRKEIYPGDSAEVYFQFTKPKIHAKRLQVGKKFQLKEGSSTVAEGEVVEILDLKIRGV